MDVPLLRTLAWKSILGFGKYSDLTVLEVYNLQHTRYLRWCYYNLSMISFNDEILSVINIRDERKIKKPGINPELHDIVCDVIKNHMGGITKIKIGYRDNKDKKINAARNNFKVGCENKASVLTRKNHGHGNR